MSSGKCLVKSLEIRNQEVTADCIAGSYTDLTARRSGIDELCLAFLYQIHRRFYMPHKDFALRCQLDFFCAPYEKCLIQFSLQCFDGLAYMQTGK